jgi:dipeptidyl aminopeptidase/acylaminoacyl peptidase
MGTSLVPQYDVQHVMVPYHQSPDLVAELTAAGVESELLTLPGAPHTPLMHMDQIIAGIAQFLFDHDNRAA